MLSPETKLRLVHALANQELADELEKRLSLEFPNQEEAEQVLASYKDDEKLREHLIVALALKESGGEIADRLDKAKHIIAAIADGDEIEGSETTRATFFGQVPGMTEDVIIQADTAGAIGNGSLLFDGIRTIQEEIDAYNLYTPSNTVSPVSGDMSQVPNADEVIMVTGGADAVPSSDTNIIPAIQAFGSQPLSDSAMERITVALASEEAAREFKEFYDQWVYRMND